jgi:hypothetical protein
VPNALSRQVSVDPEIWESTCGPQDRVEQIGVVRFRAMTLAALGGGEGTIFACSHFEHEEGRAWDWMNDAANPEDAARVEAMLHWLLAPDKFGRPHEMAVGWVSPTSSGISASSRSGVEPNLAALRLRGRPDAGNCHTNHVHFAFSWAGARAQTSWFTTKPMPLAWVPTPLSTEDGSGVEVPR